MRKWKKGDLLLGHRNLPESFWVNVVETSNRGKGEYTSLRRVWNGDGPSICPIGTTYSLQTDPALRIYRRILPATLTKLKLGLPLPRRRK